MSVAQERVEAVKRLAKAGELKALADELVGIASSAEQGWEDSRWVQSILGGMPETARVELGLELIGREITDAGARQGIAGAIQVFTRTVSHATAPAAELFLSLAARLFYAAPDRLAADARVLLDAGLPLTPEAVAVIRRTEAGGWWGAGMLSTVTADLTEPPLNVGEAWADAVNADVAGEWGSWRLLIGHARAATSAKPSAKWDKLLDPLVQDLGAQAVHDRLVSWLSKVGRARTFPLESGGYEHENVNELFDAYNATVLRGLIWALSTVPGSADSARVLGAIVETSLKRVQGVGPRSPKVANAAVFALSRMDGDPALAQLARLASTVTYKGTLKEINAALDRRAAAMSLSRDEIEELAVPTYGLHGVGTRTDTFGGASAQISVVKGAVEVVWRNDSGKIVKSPPAAVRAEHGDELKEHKSSLKDLQKMLSAQAERLDRQFLAGREWAFAAWRERYLDHPLLGTLARRLIWTVDGVACCFADGTLRDADGGEVTTGARVELWHPIGRPVQEVLAWRERLEKHEITQPFKQAHREVYPLTEAERRTGVYSNRFAAHILKQHQFHALAAARGWHNRLRLMVDDSFPPATRELPRWGVRAEFWVEGIGDDYGTDTTESGSYLRLATDQVRFYPVAAPQNWAHAGGGGYEQWVGQEAEPTEPIPLEQIPPLVLSEVLRDVDLFVGVASVGNDPTWQDGGPEGRFREYWTSYSFGELSATAQTRRAILERLVPRLAIAGRTTVDGRFLRVRGDLRTYKIHLGSGNILMEPNDQYLCIVPKQSAAEPDSGGLFLPFEGDRVLAVILSKAMLLAKDTAITDPTITRQLRV